MTRFASYSIKLSDGKHCSSDRGAVGLGVGRGSLCVGAASPKATQGEGDALKLSTTPTSDQRR
jgi:hypothetical protein